jgi:NADH-quinone oxidoreductase subunit F
VVLAVGAHKSRRLGIPGEEKQGVLHGTDFLRDIALSKLDGEGRRPPEAPVKGKCIAVVGGGDVAIDAARSAWRLGAKAVHVIYRRERQDMPAHAEEIEAADHEGIQFHFLSNPVAVLGSSHVTGVRVQRQALADFDNSGRRRPKPIDGDEFVLEVDVLIPAIGQTTDLTWMTNDPQSAAIGIETTKAGTFVVKEAFNTTRPGVFAAGDAVSGPATVIQAVAQGNFCAVAVDHWFKTGKMERPQFDTPRPDITQLYSLDDYADARRPRPPEMAVTERAGNFHEVELGFDEQTAREEAKRCLRCDLEWLDLMKVPRP